MKQTFKIWPLILIELFFLKDISSAQIVDEMMISKIENNKYIRKNFGNHNQLKNYQIFLAGSIFQKDNSYILPITIYSYDENGIFKDSTYTSYECTPKNKKMLIAVFPHAGKYSDSKVIVSNVGSANIYPEHWASSTKLDNYSFSIYMEGSLSSFFGARANLVLSDRIVNQLDKNKYSITGTLSVKSFAWGLNISTLNYIATEIIDLQLGLIYQKFVESDGSYFTMELIKR